MFGRSALFLAAAALLTAALLVGGRPIRGTYVHPRTSEQVTYDCGTVFDNDCDLLSSHPTRVRVTHLLMAGAVGLFVAALVRRKLHAIGRRWSNIRTLIAIALPTSCVAFVLGSWLYRLWLENSCPPHC